MSAQYVQLALQSFLQDQEDVIVRGPLYMLMRKFPLFTHVSSFTCRRAFTKLRKFVDSACIQVSL